MVKFTPAEMAGDTSAPYSIAPHSLFQFTSTKLAKELPFSNGCSLGGFNSLPRGWQERLGRNVLFPTSWFQFTPAEMAGVTVICFRSPSGSFQFTHPPLRRERHSSRCSHCHHGFNSLPRMKREVLVLPAVVAGQVSIHSPPMRRGSMSTTSSITR